MIYQRHILAPAGKAALDTEIAHVREHLSAVVDPEDNPRTRADEVIIRVRVLTSSELLIDEPDVLVIQGEIHAEPVAHYLSEDFDPEADHTDIIFRKFDPA